MTKFTEGPAHVDSHKNYVSVGVHKDNAVVITFDSIIYQIIGVARQHGWCIGIHGSLLRDIDLIAVPWSDKACSGEALVKCIERSTGYSAKGQSLGDHRPGGRRSILLFHPCANRVDPPHAKGTWNPKAIDLAIFETPLVAVGIAYQCAHDALTGKKKTNANKSPRS